MPSSAADCLTPLLQPSRLGDTPLLSNRHHSSAIVALPNVTRDSITTTQWPDKGATCLACSSSVRGRPTR
jgi:hypothetical protein